jgi:hypothetical protein
MKLIDNNFSKLLISILLVIIFVSPKVETGMSKKDPEPLPYF